MKSITIKSIFATLILVFATAIFAAAPASAQTVTQINAGYRGLAGLIAVDNLTSPVAAGTPYQNSLGNLIVLNGLFGPGVTTVNGTTVNGINASYAGLAGLIAVDNLTNPAVAGAASPTGVNSLGSLIVLNGLFGPSGIIVDP